MSLDPDRVRPDTTALLVIDVQNDFCSDEGWMGRRGFDLTAVHRAVETIHGFLPDARRAGVGPVFIRAHYDFRYLSPASLARMRRDDPSLDEHCKEGTWGAEFYRVSPVGDEPVVTKHRYSAFVDTRLDALLRARGVTNLLLSGITSNVCVESTARDGFMRDYHIVFLEDCTAAPDPVLHEATITNIRRFFGVVTRTGDVREAWRHGGWLS